MENWVDVPRMLAVGGEMASRIATFDWRSTPLGPIQSWPIALRTAVAMVLENRFPMALLWGRDLRNINNDAYISVLGSKHPAALGRPTAEVWPEILPILGAQLDDVLNGKAATLNEHLLLPIIRKGFLEETYFTFSFGPVRDDAGAIGGVLATCWETTVQIQDERQLQMLRGLGAEASGAASAEDACTTAARILAKNDADVPFALLYLLRAETGDAELVASTGLDGYEGAGKPSRISVRRNGGWPLSEAAAPGRLVVVEDLTARFGALPGGRWKTSPEQAVVLGLVGAGMTEPYGFLIAGVSPLRVLDQRYQRMYRLTVDSIATAVGAARALAQERRRVEELAALDRAKTTFFGDASHELRTPLTLILAPIEDLLGSVHGALPAEQRTALQLVHRNAIRLRKLVDTLMDVTRIEAGRLQPAYEAVDLAMMTGELVESFQPAFTRAGVNLRLRCAADPEPVYVDRDLWEKIVLNLLSNALKFTFAGSVDVSLSPTGGDVVLRISDTGVGIPAEALPRLFERFYRVEGTRARTAEGSGIGLALVHDLVKLHKGTIAVESAPGRGTTFTVTIPRGSAHRAAERSTPPRSSSSTAAGTAPYVSEALRWLPDEARAEREPTEAGPGEAAAERARILIADDNTDMRDYLRRLLEPRWTIDTAEDGARALIMAQAHPPDLVLTDAMMSGLDGFGLLRALRDDVRTKAIPVIMLSARAGEEAKAEGLQAGADDYLTKPFSARELLARVATQLKVARLRAQAERERTRFFLLMKQTPTPIVVYEGPELRVAFQNDAGRRLLAPADDPIGKPVTEAFPQLAGQPSTVALRQAYETGRPMSGPPMRLRIPDGNGVVHERIFDLRREPIRDEHGKVTGVLSLAFEITEQVRARRQLEASEQRYRTIFEMVEVSLWEEDLSGVKRLVDELKAAHGSDLRRALTENPALVQQAIELVRIRDVNPATLRMFGASSKEEMFSSLSRIFVPATAALFVEQLVSIAEGKRLFATDGPMRSLSGEPIDVAFTEAFAQDDDNYERGLVTLTNVSPQAEARREREARISEMERAVRFGEMFIGIVGHDLRNPLSAITTAAGLLQTRADSERIARPARRVVASAGRMERMISQLLDFTRIRLGGGLPLGRSEVDLAEVARSIIEELEPVHHRDIRLHGTANLVGQWDRDRLSQLLSNLAANACQHGDPGTPVEISLDGTEAGRVTIMVANRGVIPPALVPIVFEPLRHTAGDHSPARGGSSGLGLGLYITQQITLAHGGKIRVESTDAEGTRFIVELPRRG